MLQDEPDACHLGAQELAQDCEGSAQCNAVLYQSQGCCSDTTHLQSGWLKTLPSAAASAVTSGQVSYADCTAVQPYSTLYIYTEGYGHASAAAHTGAVAGGEVSTVFMAEMQRCSHAYPYMLSEVSMHINHLCD